MCKICERMEADMNQRPQLYDDPEDAPILTIRRMIYEFGATDGAHHKQWLIDQIWQVVFPEDEDIEAWYEAHCSVFGWDRGIAP